MKTIITMVKSSTMFIAGITFSTGLLIGLLLHLPGVYSPVSSYRTKRDTRDGHRTLLSSMPVMDESSYTSHNNNTLLHIKRNDSVNVVNKYSSRNKNKNNNKSMSIRGRMNIKRGKSDYVRPLVSKEGLLQTISTFKQPQDIYASRSTQSKLKNDTSINVEQASQKQSKQVGVDSFKPYVHNSNEIEIVVNKAKEKTDIDPVKEDGEFVNLDDVIQGIYWAYEAPRGFGLKEEQRWRQVFDDGKVVRVDEGCGRMQNRKVTLNDGTVACARYRLNTDQMQGEIYSYYLAKLLGIANVPPTLLALADTLTDTWGGVSEDVMAAQWHPTKVLALTPWLENLEPAFIPQGLRQKDSKAIMPDKIGKITEKELIELTQWSDLIIFDYLTANVDRVVNNMFNLQWNSAMMDSPAHNLEKSQKNGQLVFLDNESGLFHSYRLLNRYSNYHEELLSSLCVFRQSTADAVTSLHNARDIGVRLQTTFEENEPLSRYLPRIPLNNLKTLQTRIDNVYNQIQKCQLKYGLNNSQNNR